MSHRIDEQITFRKLEALLAFLETGNLARAGEQLGTSAVSVHRALKSLEEGTRCALFRHEGRNLVPLESAQVLADVAREVLDGMAQGVRAVREAGGYSSDQLRIGSLYSLTLRLVPRLVAELRARKPDLQTELVLDANDRLLDRLHRNSLDAVLIVLPEQLQNLETLPMFEDELVFAAPPQWRVRGDGPLELQQYAAEKFITLGEDFATGKNVQEAFRRAGFAPQIAMRTSDIFSLMNLVKGGIGCALLPTRARDASSEPIQWLPLAPRYRVPHQVGLVFLKARERDPNVLSLLAVCRSLGPSLRPCS
ncbi:LysR family transcriptional regulator [Corticibacter populi]|uniref:LysR family transcriptional regulator n=1 Tax=Corticibacter populi TaxID=1550736 RepID=A0A3M6QUR2_9BURK|nr:LysR family transcriptional regulator [Corticibacter populi]RMX06621.1 LysR family transcriptional regulator [Corticibacter populi]RZS31809.1 LysR family malonate utilization transcriptional regulator [Corticibacter populi]